MYVLYHVYVILKDFYRLVIEKIKMKVFYKICMLLVFILMLTQISFALRYFKPTNEWQVVHEGEILFLIINFWYKTKLKESILFNIKVNYIFYLQLNLIV